MRLFVVAAAIVLALPIAARAEPVGLTPVPLVALPPELTPLPVVASPPPPAEDLSSYRLQTVFADGAAIGATIVAVKSGSAAGEVGTVALAMYLLGAPAVHMYHRHPKRAAASLALRVGLPLLGGLIGHGFAPPATGGDWGNLAGSVDSAFGALIGGIAASAIDIGYLSGPTASSAPPIAPAFAAGPGQIRIGFGGTF